MQEKKNTSFWEQVWSNKIVWLVAGYLLFLGAAFSFESVMNVWDAETRLAIELKEQEQQAELERQKAEREAEQKAKEEAERLAAEQQAAEMEPVFAAATTFTAITGEQLTELIQTSIDEKLQPTLSHYTPAGIAFDPNDVMGSAAGDIARFKASNSDVVGWLTVPNTNIDYPVVQGPNNNYYLSRGYDKAYSFDGVIWADSDNYIGGRNSISKNNVIYGHNWYNCWRPIRMADPGDTMFEQLASFDYLSFAQATPYIRYSSANDDMIFKVFAVFYTETGFNYINCNPSDAAFENILSEAKKRSIHNYSVDVNTSDKIITLSTCTLVYGNRHDQRFVVMARLLRPGESVEAVNITSNPGHKQPQF